MMNLSIKTKDIFYLLNKYSNIISKLEAEILLCHLFNCEKVDLYVKDFVVDDFIERQYGALVNRRIDGEPIQYITGWAEFMGFRFIVDRNIFIPRPETELLVNEALSVISNRLSVIGNIQVLDLCTGSGNIAVSLAKLLSEVEIVATDISESALKTAEANAVFNKVSNRIKFYKGDLFNALPVDINQKFDIIVCNPPYIKTDELLLLQREVRFEPEIALNGNKDGIGFYRRIATQVPNYLKKDGVLLLEIGFGQAEIVKDIFSSTNRFGIKKVVEDFGTIERVVIITPWINSL